MVPNPFDDRPARSSAKVQTICAVVVTANVASWIWAGVTFTNRPALMGMAVLAYTLGLRHAFDADHIAAIDNVVRKLRQADRFPYSAGFFFSLGHSTIVVIASVVVAAASAAFKARLGGVQHIGGIVGTAVSAIFLLLIGVANFILLIGTWLAYSSMRHGASTAAADLNALLAGQSFLTRFFRPMFQSVTRSWHMYPVGFLFGLGFDTATEIGVLGISAAQAAQNMSFWNILVFPALFTAGMSLMDTTDSVVMTGAYGWAFVTPARKLWYNLTITAASIGVALFVGGVEALGLIGQKLGFGDAFWRVVGGLNGSLTQFGFVTVGIFIATWVASMALYRIMPEDAAGARQT